MGFLMRFQPHPPLEPPLSPARDNAAATLPPATYLTPGTASAIAARRHHAPRESHMKRESRSVACQSERTIITKLFAAMALSRINLLMSGFWHAQWACLPAVLPGGWGAGEWRGRRVLAGAAAGRPAAARLTWWTLPPTYGASGLHKLGQNGRETGRLAPYVLPGRRRRPAWAVHPAARRRLKLPASHKMRPVGHRPNTAGSVARHQEYAWAINGQSGRESVGRAAATRPKLITDAAYGDYILA